MILHELLQQLDMADVEAIVDCLYDWGRRHGRRGDCPHILLFNRP